jgi:hypothetical protein
MDRNQAKIACVSNPSYSMGGGKEKTELTGMRMMPARIKMAHKP